MTLPAVEPVVEPAHDASFDPTSGERTGAVTHSTDVEVGQILHRADRAAPVLAALSPATRRAWIAAAADAALAVADELVDLARAETGLGVARLEGELNRMAASARFYAGVAC